MRFNLLKVFSLFAFFFVLNSLFSVQILAFCPVCTVAVGAGVGLSRYLGIDDTVTGVWVGGLTISMIMWTINWLRSKNKTFKFDKIIIALVYYLLIVVPLTYSDIIGHPLNRLFGIDKLLLGIVFGSLIFLLSGEFYNRLKERNDGHAHFPFEKVVIPVSSLVLLSLVFYFITKTV